MPYYEFVWTDEILDHLAEHDVDQGDFERIVCNPLSRGFSRSSNLPAAWGYTKDGRYVIAIYEKLDELTILPATAYRVSEPH